MTNSISMYNRFIEDSGNRSVLPELIEADLKEIKTVTVDREHLADYLCTQMKLESASIFPMSRKDICLSVNLYQGKVP